MGMNFKGVVWKSVLEYCILWCEIGSELDNRVTNSTPTKHPKENTTPPPAPPGSSTYFSKSAGFNNVPR